MKIFIIFFFVSNKDFEKRKRKTISIRNRDDDEKRTKHTHALTTIILE